MVLAGLVAFIVWAWRVDVVRAEGEAELPRVGFCGPEWVDQVLSDARGWAKVVTFERDCERPDFVVVYSSVGLPPGGPAACWCDEYPKRVIFRDAPPIRRDGSVAYQMHAWLGHEVGHVLGLDHRDTGIMSPMGYILPFPFPEEVDAVHALIVRFGAAEWIRQPLNSTILA